MSVAKTSASWVAIASGKPASSVAANSEERIVPLPMRTCAASGAVSVRGLQPAGDPLDPQAGESRTDLVGARAA